METNSRPLLHQVIRDMDRLNGELEKLIDNNNTMLPLRHAAVLSLGILDKYYAKTDDSIMYRGALSK